mmetsp:Transcript_22911/g.64913  ORF Transcript_22911/g.64913 Transcript_22911/m.64913 type:complete len:206 (-) Transcript_22911:196-813(-)
MKATTTATAVLALLSVCTQLCAASQNDHDLDGMRGHGGVIFGSARLRAVVPPPSWSSPSLPSPLTKGTPSGEDSEFPNERNLATTGDDDAATDADSDEDSDADVEDEDSMGSMIAPSAALMQPRENITTLVMSPDELYTDDDRYASNGSAFTFPQEQQQPDHFAVWVVIAFTALACLLFGITCYRRCQRKRQGYQSVPAATSMVV